MRSPIYQLKRRKSQREAREASERVNKILADQAREITDMQHYPDFLVVGEDIWIGCKQHTVQPGETLEDIARMNGTTIKYVCYSNSVTYVPPLTVIEWP
jgi:hypothetical protein